jgi:hypothetical protein
MKLKVNWALCSHYPAHGFLRLRRVSCRLRVLDFHQRGKTDNCAACSAHMHGTLHSRLLLPLTVARKTI